MNELPQATFSLPDLVVVTGTASGLGASIAHLLLSSKCKVIGIDISLPSNILNNGSYRHVQGDISQEATWDEVDRLITELKPKRLGFLSAAAVLQVGSVLDFSRQDVAKTMDVNFFGTVLAFQRMVPHMLKLGGGSIVAVASIDATFAEQQLSIYCASKAAVRQLTRTVALDFAREGLRANVLSPGAMRAGLFDRHMQSANDPAKFLAAREARQPSGRILDPEEVGRAALYLLSDASMAINGAEIVADGGLTTGFDFRTGAEGASV